MGTASESGSIFDGDEEAHHADVRRRSGPDGKFDPDLEVVTSDDRASTGPDLVFMTNDEDAQDEKLLADCGKRQDVKVRLPLPGARDAKSL